MYFQKQQKTFFIDEDLRNSLLNRQMASQITYIDQINPFPDEIENLYHQLFPLEQTDLKSYTFNPIQISTFRINRRDGIQFCMKRIHGTPKIKLKKKMNLWLTGNFRLPKYFSSWSPEL